MALKFQHNIDELGIGSICPPKDLLRIDLAAFRWVFDPIDHKLNFLPNYEFDKERGFIEPYQNGAYDNAKKCSRCSQSFFNTLEAAKINHRKLPKVIKDSLGYTHIASGDINAIDGEATKINNNGHFSFYDDDKSNLSSKFNICDKLDSWT